jgi:hypothetical protein
MEVSIVKTNWYRDHGPVEFGSRKSRKNWHFKIWYWYVEKRINSFTVGIEKLSRNLVETKIFFSSESVIHKIQYLSEHRYVKNQSWLTRFFPNYFFCCDLLTYPKNLILFFQKTIILLKIFSKIRCWILLVWVLVNFLFEGQNPGNVFFRSC